MTIAALLKDPAFNLTDVDRQVLAQTDEEFHYHDWAELQDIIARGDLGVLKRKPSDLVRYLQWTKHIKAEYGSSTNYICLERLKWPLPEGTVAVNNTATSNGCGGTATPTAGFTFKNPTPFADAADYKILRNDWPYGIAEGISHLVVWLRTPIAVKGDGKGMITEESRVLIEDFVQRTFVDRIAKKDGMSEADAQAKVIWFKNYTALQSVRGLEHVHVLLKDVPETLLHEWTGE
ncbi:hypothetical protein BDV18DRAFT_163000 [Aspergillus unguis]